MLKEGRTKRSVWRDEADDGKGGIRGPLSDATVHAQTPGTMKKKENRDGGGEGNGAGRKKSSDQRPQSHDFHGGAEAMKFKLIDCRKT